MIKKILLLLFLIIVCMFFIIFYLVDRVYINSYIKNLENKERNILIEDGELSIKKIIILQIPN